MGLITENEKKCVGNYPWVWCKNEKVWFGWKNCGLMSWAGNSLWNRSCRVGYRQTLWGNTIQKVLYKSLRSNLGTESLKMTTITKFRKTCAKKVLPFPLIPFWREAMRRWYWRVRGFCKNKFTLRLWRLRVKINIGYLINNSLL